jgi:hypothetical protein
MRRSLSSLIAVGLLLALPALGVRSARVEAAGMGFRNDLKTPVVIQGANIVNGMLRRSKPLVLLPGKTGWDTNLPPGNRIVTVYDYFQPNRILFQGTVAFQGNDMFFAVQAVGTPPQLRLMPMDPPKK